MGAVHSTQTWMHALGILQNTKHTNDDQSAKTLATSYREHVLPLLNHRGWKELIFNETCNARINVTIRRLCVTIVARGELVIWRP